MFTISISVFTTTATGWKRPVNQSHRWVHAERTSSAVCAVSPSHPVLWVDALFCVCILNCSVLYCMFSAVGVFLFLTRYQQILHRNIVYLATIADATSVNTPTLSNVRTHFRNSYRSDNTMSCLITADLSVFQPTSEENAASTQTTGNGQGGTWRVFCF